MAADAAGWPGQAFWFGRVESRPLSLFRIAFALVLLRDALLHLPLAALFYSDAGVVPRAAVWQMLGRPPLALSLMDALPEAWMATLFFALWGGVALCLLVGYRTRLMALLNFLMVLSIYRRNPFILSGADDILRVLSFWMLFIPLDHHYTLGTTPRPTTAYAFPVRLMQLQVALIYLVTGLFKLLGTPWWEGTALFYVLQLDSLLLPTGKWLASHSPMWLLQGVTYQVLLLELTFPVLVFVPLGQPTLRRAGILLAALMHLAIALTMTMPLPDFLLVLGASYLLFFAVPAPLPAGARGLPHPLLTVMLGVLMAAVLWQNADSLRAHRAVVAPPLPSVVTSTLDLIGLRQGWDLFAPTPLQVDGSIVIPGTFEDQSRYDLRTGAPLAAVIRAVPPGEPYRWKRFEQVVGLHRPAPLLEGWALYYCQLHNEGPLRASPPHRLHSLQIRLLSRTSHPPGVAPNPIQDDLLWIQRCS